MSITFCNGHGTVSLTDDELPGRLGDGSVIEFAAGLPGFPHAHRFRLESLGAALHPFQRLRHLGPHDLEIGFTVVAAGLLYPDYSVEIDEDHQASLGISSADDVVTYLLITVPRPPQPPTANLLGPVVINRRTGAAAQVVQHRSSYRVAEPLPASRPG